jgi:hypothetical protein
MLEPLRRVFHIENDDFIGAFIDRVLDQIAIFVRDKLAHALGLLKTADIGEENEVLGALIDPRPHALRSSRISLSNVMSDRCNILDGSRREPKLH